MSVRGFPYFINPQAHPLGSAPLPRSQPLTEPCRFCSQPGHMAFYYNVGNFHDRIPT